MDSIDARVAYWRNRKRVKRLRGVACEQLCVDCDEEAKDWSWIHGTDPSEIDNYERYASKHTNRLRRRRDRRRMKSAVDG